MARIFITGGTGCIGATTVFNLLNQFGSDIDQILIATRSSNTDQLKIWFGDELDSLVASDKIKFVACDLGDKVHVAQTMTEFAPTHVIHLGALQSPDCQSDPEKGVAVNLTGTMNLFHAIEKFETPLQRLVFASSGAVYGKRAMYASETVPEDAQLAPPNLYGVWKVAGEHLAALFHEKTKVPTVCLRLNTTFGPGRDQGTTSAPTRVMKTLAKSASSGSTEKCLMPYQGRENYHYVEDVGAHFAGVCMMPYDGFGAFNIKGRTIEVSQFLDYIAAVAAELGIDEYLETGIDDSATPNLFICDLEDSKIEATFPGLPRTDLKEGIRKSLVKFQAMALDS